MPNRMLRDSARGSKKLARVNAEAERLYWRLLMVADDFGRFDADPIVIRALCFPRHGSAISDQTIRSAWLDLVMGGLMLEYEVNGDVLGQFVKWDQRVRAKESKFKGPECGHLRAVDGGVRSSAAVVVDVVGDVDVGGGGDVVGMPPAPEFNEPEAKQRCSECWELLGLLAAVPVYFASPSEAELRVIHEAHETAGQPRAVAAVRGQIEQHRAGKIIKRFLSPEVLFKRKNWQVTVNATSDHPPIERAERV